MNRRKTSFYCECCGNHIYYLEKCKIKKLFCADCKKEMIRVKGFFCHHRLDLNGKKCDGCGYCDTGTDEDFDRYAVQVQNGDGYYDANGSYHSYYNGLDEY